MHITQKVKLVCSGLKTDYSSKIKNFSPFVPYSCKKFVLNSSHLRFLTALGKHFVEKINSRIDIQVKVSVPVGCDFELILFSVD
jgi:hypothetical protein